MKIAVVTANIGNFDPILGLPKQDAEFTYFFYNENNLPFPLPNLNNRLKSKYIKIQMHRFLPNYDMYIWLDGRIKVQADTFVKTFVQQIENKDIVLYKHRERDNVYQEIEYIIEQMNKGNHYLLSRYGNQQLFKEAIFYKDNDLPNDFPLVMSGVFARMNNKIVNACFDEWWQRCIEFSYFDQTMLSCVLYQHGLNVNFLPFDEIRTPKLFKVTSHIQ